MVLATAAQAWRAACGSSPAKVSFEVGKAIQVRSCGCHSAGMAKPSSAGVVGSVVMRVILRGDDGPGVAVSEEVEAQRK